MDQPDSILRWEAFLLQGQNKLIHFPVKLQFHQVLIHFLLFDILYTLPIPRPPLW